MARITALCSFFVLLFCCLGNISGKRVVCYFTNWAWYRNDPGKQLPEDIDSNLCTHINYAFALLDANELTLIPSDTWADIDNNFYRRVTGLKSKNSNLKVLLSLGGWVDSESDKYSRLVRDPQRRKNFIQKVIPFLKQYGFDGLDLDWEYPRCWQGNCDRGPESDRANFALWVKELREAFNRENPRLLLTAAVVAAGQTVDKGYDVPSIARDMDFINIMTYDFHNSFDGRTGHHSQRAKRNGDSASDYNVEDAANYWASKGAPKDRLVVGLPAYGRTFKLANPSNNGLRAPTNGAGNQGEITKEPGMLAYLEICNRLKHSGWRKQRDPSVGPWASKDDQWVGYDDPEDAARKGQWASSNGFGGVMVWDLSLDDFKGRCCGRNYPFLRAMNYGMLGVGQAPNSYGCP